jgi:hypothetical protein
MEYDGCCSSSALAEAVTGEEEGLTLEQMAAKQVEMDKRREAQLAAKSAAYYEFKANDFEAYKALQRYTTLPKDTLTGFLATKMSTRTLLCRNTPARSVLEPFASQES